MEKECSFSLPRAVHENQALATFGACVKRGMLANPHWDPGRFSGCGAVSEPPGRLVATQMLGPPPAFRIQRACAETKKICVSNKLPGNAGAAELQPHFKKACGTGWLSLRFLDREHDGWNGYMTA